MKPALELDYESSVPNFARRSSGLLPKGSTLAVAVLLLLEILIFSRIGTNFFSQGNAFEIPRQSVELGLLALAMTPVIVTGGIDLSVGSLMGLCAILFGKLWRDAQLPPLEAAAITLAIGVFAGGLNALAIARFRLPPLVVTLGTLSLFRGLAEGLTRGIDNFTGFPASFLSLGQGYIGSVPMQLPVLALAIVVFWILLHKSVIGRAWSAIGYSPEGARFAAIPVGRRIALAYMLSGLCAALAAIIYVARSGQAKADAGTGYELAAITAVVLGGTSIFGGKGSIGGTVLGLFAIAVLQNGLRLADISPEFAGILTGGLLLAAVALDRRAAIRKLFQQSPASSQFSNEEFEMKNSQLAALCVVILAAAFIVVGGNWMLAKTMREQGATPAASGPAGPTGRRSRKAPQAHHPGHDAQERRQRLLRQLQAGRR